MNMNYSCSKYTCNNPPSCNACPTKDLMWKGSRCKGHWQAKFHSSGTSTPQWQRLLSGHCYHRGCGQIGTHANITEVVKDKDWTVRNIWCWLPWMSTQWLCRHFTRLIWPQDTSIRCAPLLSNALPPMSWLVPSIHQILMRFILSR